MPAPKSPEFRRRALDLVAQGEPVSATARGSGSASRAYDAGWQDNVDAGRSEGLERVEKRELVGVRRRTGVLEMENEILERASAYFARENVLPK